MDERQYFVYITTNQRHTVLYTGVTNNLERRMYEHKNHVISSFTSKYRCGKLVYYEMTGSIESAISREKQIKSGSRKKKLALIESINAQWVDLCQQCK